MARVRLSNVDLVRRVAVVRVLDDGSETLPHVLRGTLAGLLGEPGWHVIAAYDHDGPDRPAVTAVLEQAATWAAEHGCRLSVTPLRGLRAVAASDL